MTKTESLLTISILHQAGKWRELREMTIKKSLANPIPNSPNPNHKSCMADSKENYYWDPGCRGVKGQNCGSIKGDFSMMRKTHCASNELVISFGIETFEGVNISSSKL